MKVILACLLVAAAFASHPVSQRLTEEINQSGSTWTAMKPEENPFAYMTSEEIKSMMGTKLMSMPEIKPRFAAYQKEADLPENFDATTDPKTAHCVHAIRDQASCGSCWAFGATEALSDRFCLAGVDVILSPEEMVECDKKNMACNGGWLNVAWSFLESHGVCSDACQPYVSGSGNVPACHDTTCDNGEEMKHYKCKSGSIVHPTKTDDIKREIYHNGPMEIAFTVYADFMSYKSGVYQHTTGGVMGGHAVKVTGWGVQDGVEYWQCANSWGDKWGEQGSFKIKIGDCGINNQLYACTPDV